MPVADVLTTIRNGARARIRSIPLRYNKTSLGIANVLLDHGFLHNMTRGTVEGPSPRKYNQAPLSIRRLWIDIKYGTDDRPVLGHADNVSKPSKRCFMNANEMLQLVTGRKAKFVQPLNVGEIAIVRCRDDINPLSPDEAARQQWVHPTMKAWPRAQHSTAFLKSRYDASPPSTERYMEAREAVGRGLNAEVIARVG